MISNLPNDLEKLDKELLEIDRYGETIPEVEEFEVAPQYSKGWKAIHFKIGRPRGLKQWTNAIWGLDIFIHKVPFLKVSVLANIIYWILK